MCTLIRSLVWDSTSAFSATSAAVLLRASSGLSKTRLPCLSRALSAFLEQVWLVLRVWCAAVSSLSNLTGNLCHSAPVKAGASLFFLNLLRHEPCRTPSRRALLSQITLG